MKRSLLLAASLAAALSLPPSHSFAQAAPEYRQWTDKASGKQIEASMVSADATARTVTIQRKDGSTFTLPVARLADDDLAYIRAKLAAPATAPASTPPAPGAPPAAPAPGAPPAAPAAPAAPVGQPAPPAPVIAVTPAKKFKHPAGGSIMGTVKKTRPRLLANPEMLAAMKGRLATDAITKTLFDGIQKTGELMLEKPELTKVYGEDNPVGRQSIFRLTHLGLLSQLTGDPRWVDRGVKELMALSKDFTNWSPTEGKTVAEFVTGVAIGYDWFRASLNPEQAKLIRANMVQLGVDALTDHLKGEPVRATTKKEEPGVVDQGNKPAAPKVTKKPEEKGPPNAEEMAMASALMLAAISLAEDEPNVANPAANLAAKTLGEGITGFGPDGIWPESLVQGDEVLEGLAAVVNTYRSACGSDFGISTVEGLANIGIARMYLTGPAGVFNFGSAQGSTLTRTWLTSWLASIYGNPGLPALRASPAGVDPLNAGFMGAAGLLLYHSPYMGGYGAPAPLDKAFANTQVATLRSAWNDNKAMFIGLKGGTNAHAGAQLDLGSFVLDAGGVRWGVDLGAESEKVVKDNSDPKRFANYREGSLGQNLIRMGGGGTDPDEEKDSKKKAAPVAPGQDPNNQAIEDKAVISAMLSTPEKGIAILDLSDVWSAKAKEWKRGAMMVRGATPHVILQDEWQAKGNGSVDWIMHTRATEVTPSGNKATLKQGANLLTATIVSPAGATFEVADPPEVKNEQAKVTGVKLLKIAIGGAKGPRTVSVVFASGDTTPEVPLVPLEQWVPKKK